MTNKELCEGKSGGISLDKHHSLINKKQSIMPTDDKGGFAASSISDLKPDELKTPIDNSKVKKYIGCKIIAAEQMTETEFLKTVKGMTDEEIKQRETQGNGYKVIYPDNYISWSPKDVFEESYREVSAKEFKILIN